MTDAFQGGAVEALKPCPFCGEPEARMDEACCGAPDHDIATMVACGNCGAGGPAISGGGIRAKEEAAYAWNERAGPPPRADVVHLEECPAHPHNTPCTCP